MVVKYVFSIQPYGEILFPVMRINVSIYRGHGVPDDVDLVHPTVQKRVLPL